MFCPTFFSLYLLFHSSFSMMDVFYLIPCVFCWLFFPTEDAAYNPACAIFFYIFFNTLKMLSAHLHIRLLLIHRDVGLQFGEKKPMTCQILIRQRIELKYEAPLSKRNTVWMKTMFFFLCSSDFGCWEEPWWKSYQVPIPAFLLGLFVTSCWHVWGILMYFI